MTPRLALAVALTGVLPAAQAQTAPGAITVRDDRGVAVTLPRAPMRVVSLLPSLTEVVCDLGRCDRLVGVDDFSNWPASVQHLPRLGGLEDARIEAIVALKPDVVLLAGSTRALERLRSLGVNVVALEPRTLADLRRTYGVLGQLLGVESQAAWQRIDAGLDAVARTLPATLRGTSVYVEVSPLPHAAGASSFVGEALTRLGLRNIVAAEMGPFPQLNPEFVVRAQPQRMVLTAVAAPVGSRPGWQTLAAVREGRVCRLTPAQDDVLMRPGPRVVEAARLLVACVRGDWSGPRQ